MDLTDVLFVSLFTVAGLGSFIRYRREPTRANFNYLALSTVSAAIATAGPFLLAIPGLTEPQKGCIRAFIISYFTLVALYLFIGGVIILYLQHRSGKG